MLTRVYSHVRRQPVAYLALFVALGGTSYAAVQLPRDSVGSRQIRAGAVGASELRQQAVTLAKIANAARTELRGARGPEGVRGPEGPQGIRGPEGVRGPEGLPGRLDGPAGGDLTGNFPDPTIDPAAAILNQAAGPQDGSMFLDGTIRTTGQLRLGSETIAGPSYPAGSDGLTIRRVYTPNEPGHELARFGPGGIVKSDEFSSNPGPAYVWIENRTGATIRPTCGAAPSMPSGYVDNLPNGTNGILLPDVYHLDCMFSHPDGHQTYLVASRLEGFSWTGFIISTYDQ
ncbi:MAG TPA: hypothetical protein VHF50_06035 [Solirubrobacterales bacterium]|nr:hypothetical protein [Solirubrobacterales bacterium]